MLYYKTIENSNLDNWVVMVHGAGGSIETWFRQVADFARHYNLLLVDLAGHGGSANERFGSNFNFSRAADQVMEVVNHLQIKKAHFIGLSLGTIIVRLIAKKYPQQVLSMILAGAITKLGAKLVTLITLATKFKKLIPYSLIKTMIAKYVIPHKRYNSSKTLVMGMAQKLPFDSFLNWLDLGNRGAQFIKELFEENNLIPTLYLMGEDDRLFLPQVRETVKKATDNVCMLIIPKAGHVCNVDNKKIFNQYTLQFMHNLSC